MNPEPCARSRALVSRRGDPRRTLQLVLLMTLGWVSPQTQAASPARPAIDLTVQVRLISDADWEAEQAHTAPTSAATHSLSSAPPTEPALSMQSLRVHNGERASMSWSQALPIQWLQAATLRGSSARNGHAGVVNALVWLHAGQSLSVRPSWPGGRQPVRVELQIDTERLGERQGQEVPPTHRQTSSSTLVVPRGQWTTFAATGAEAPPQSPTTWSTQSRPGRQLMQLRVTPD